MFKKFFSGSKKINLKEIYEKNIEPHVTKIEEFAPYLSTVQAYHDSLQKMNESKNLYESSGKEEQLNEFYAHLQNYVTIVRQNAKQYKLSKNLVSELRAIDEVCKVHNLKPSELDKDCEEKCTFEKDGYEHTLFCQFCRQTPVAKFIEQLELSQDNINDYTKQYFFAQIIWQIIRELGVNSQETYKTICEEKVEDPKCKNCHYYCSIAQKEFGHEQDWKVYARGLRFVDDLKETMYAKFDLVAKPLALLKRLTEKVINHQNADWNDISGLVELLDILPDFLKRAVSVKLLEPRGIRLFQAGVKTKSYAQQAMEKFLDWQLPKLQIK
jgi:hypothetical protein